MARKLPPKDVVIIGLGWTGSILGYELAKAGLDVVAIERGPWRDTATDFPPAYTQDELRYAVRLDLFLRPDQETLTFRNNMSQTALPIRSFVSFLPGNGVGGAGVHWNGQTWRFLPTDFDVRSHLEERYGKDALPSDMTIQDWPLSYDEIEPYYDRFEKLCGTSGKAGNIKGVKQPGGNPFEGWRSSEYPTPPLKQGLGADPVRRSGAQDRTHAVSAAGIEFERGLYQSARHEARPMHLLRLLRTFRLRQLFQGKPADLRAAGAAALSEFQRADRIRGDEDQSGFDRQARHRRDLCRYLG